MFFGWRWVDRANHIHSPHFEQPWRSCRVKMSWCLMNEVTMDLTGVTSLSISNGIRDHLWLIIPQSLELIFKLRTRLMSSTQTVMRFFEYFLCLFVWQAAEEDSVMWSAIQCSCDRIVAEFRGFPSNGSRLFRVRQAKCRTMHIQCTRITNLWALDLLTSLGLLDLKVFCQLLDVFKSTS